MVGKFNVDCSKEILFNFIQEHNAGNIAKDKTCFKSLNKLRCTDPFTTNRPWCFQNTTVFATGLSDFYKTAVAVLKVSFSKEPLKEILHRDCKSFEQDKFKYELKNRIQNGPIECYSEFEKAFVDILNDHAPFKKKLLRVNYAPCMTKRLRKAIMKISKLKSKYLKFKTQ